MKLVKLMIKYGANDFNLGLKGACYGGHKEIAELMIKYGEQKYNDYNWGLRGACRGGNMELAISMIKYGAYEFNDGLFEDMY